METYLTKKDTTASTASPDIITSLTQEPVSVTLVITDSDGTVVFSEYVGGRVTLDILSTYVSSGYNSLSIVPHFLNAIGKSCYVTTDINLIKSILGVLMIYSGVFRDLDDLLSIVESPCCNTFNFIVHY